MLNSIEFGWVEIVVVKVEDLAREIDDLRREIGILKGGGVAELEAKIQQLQWQMQYRFR
jgi:uncharacterized coiled-coil DUF342 family protein